MREIFNASVSAGDSYKLIYCHMANFTNAVLVEVTRHSNFMVGYKTGQAFGVRNPDFGRNSEFRKFFKQGF